MRQIKLTKGLAALVDDDDYDRLNQFKWCASFHDPNFYAVRGGPDGLIRMHREVLGLKRGDKRVGHHINENTLDNRKENLEACTNNKNMSYCERWRGSKTGGAEVPEYKRKNG